MKNNLLMLILTALTLVLIFVTLANAADWPVVVTSPSGQGTYFFAGSIIVTDDDTGVQSFRPGDTPVNLGLPLDPWRNLYVQNKVSAQSFVAAGASGINTVIHFGQCVLTIQGGIIVSAVVPPANQPCP